MKTVILIFCFLLFKMTGFSQNIMLDDSMSYYYQHENYPRAVYFGKLKVDDFIKTYGKDHANHGVALSDLGLVYSAMNKYSEAEALFKQAIIIYKKTIGELNTNYVGAKKNLAVVYSNTNRFIEAEKMLKEVSEFYKNTEGEESIRYAGSLTDMGSLFTGISRFNEAESMYSKALAIYKNNSGEEDKEYIVHLNNLGMVYYKKGDYKSAEPVFLQVISLIKKTGETNSSYSAVLGNLASIYKNDGRYSEAEPLQKKSLELAKTIYGVNSYQYNAALNNFADLNRLQGKIKPAETLYRQSLDIVSATEGKTSTSYAHGLNNLGKIKEDEGNYEKALELFQEASALFKKNGGEETVDFAVSLNNIAAVYVSMGKHALVEPLYLHALAILKKVVGEKHPDYLKTLNNLAVYYYNIDNTEQAGYYSRKALELKAESGTDNPSYAISLVSLAEIQKGLGNFGSADSLYAKALPIYMKVYGKDHPMTASFLVSMAGFLKTTGNFRESEFLYKKALATQKKLLGESHPDYALTLNNFAGLYLLTGNTTEAEAYFEQAIKIYRSNKGNKGSVDFVTLNNMAEVYLVNKKFSQANDLFIEGLQTEKQQLLDKLNFLSEPELLSFLEGNEKIFLHSFTSLYSHPSDTLLKALYNYQLFWKGVSVQNSTSLNRYIERTKDTSLINMWILYLENKEILNRQLSVPLTQHNLDIDSLENVCDQLEKNLLRQSSAFRNVKEQLSITWQDVRKNLLPGEAAVEFVKFNYSYGFSPDSVLYAAIVLKPGDKSPSLIQLFEESLLTQLLSSGSNDGVAERGIALDGTVKNLPAGSYEKLYQLIWKPLAGKLKGIHKVYYAADGLLYKISFAALQISKDKFLADEYRLEQVNSTREVAIKRNELRAPSSIALFGGADYEQQEASSVTGTNAPTFVAQSRSSSLASFNYLPGTLAEVQHIRQTMEAHQIKVLCYTGKAATEDAFRLQSNKAADVMHIATHGFSLADEAVSRQQDITAQSNSNLFKASHNPLLRCGLIMAGGNKGWAGTAKENEDDGILTALEITALDFSNTRLVVLSACESGLGEIKGSEGVFGLQRAFKIAGASYIMAALWKVPDEPTEQFMTTFYQQWMSGKNIQQAFWQTQQSMRQRGFAANDWAAFTLIH